MRVVLKRANLALRAELRAGHLFQCVNPDCEALLTRGQVLEHQCPTRRELLEELAAARHRGLEADSPFPARSVRGGR